eukprot:109554-Pyramimonas_sp.AAC.1
MFRSPRQPECYHHRRDRDLLPSVEARRLILVLASTSKPATGGEAAEEIAVIEAGGVGQVPAGGAGAAAARTARHARGAA